MKNEKFYFTFNLIDGDLFFPYEYYDYVLVLAHSRKEAIEIYRKSYSDVHKGVVNCAQIYTEEEWIADNICEHYKGRHPVCILSKANKGD